MGPSEGQQVLDCCCRLLLTKPFHCDLYAPGCTCFLRSGLCHLVGPLWRGYHLSSRLSGCRNHILLPDGSCSLLLALPGGVLGIVLLRLEGLFHGLSLHHVPINHNQGAGPVPHSEPFGCP